jgi:hypothetical protein
MQIEKKDSNFVSRGLICANGKGCGRDKTRNIETKIREASQNQSNRRRNQTENKFRVPSLLGAWIYDKGEEEDRRSR